jgi:hydroxymethylpyrimidine pyrophosphatase-like HAD family hydrolase
MLNDAGLGVAMGNAVDEVKASADLVIGSNRETGIADVVNQYFDAI